MTARAAWAYDDATEWGPVYQEARRDLLDLQDDLAELARLEDEVANPPINRIPDEKVWYRMRQDAIRELRQRWGVR